MSISKVYNDGKNIVVDSVEDGITVSRVLGFPACDEEPACDDTPPSAETGGEWKRLARVEVAEDNVSYFLFTTDENGEAFQAKDITVRMKAVKRTAVTGFRVMKPGYRGGKFDFALSKTIAQTNSFGNTSGDRYYVVQLIGEGNWRKVSLTESNADIFSTTADTNLVAFNVYQTGTSYTVGSVKYPINEIALYSNNGFMTGDILEVWYR